MKRPDSLEVWAAKAAALLAQRINAPQLWQAGIARFLMREVRKYTDNEDDTNVRAFVLAFTAHRNGIRIDWDWTAVRPPHRRTE